MTTPTDEEAIRRISDAIDESDGVCSYDYAKAAWAEAQAIMAERENGRAL